MMIYLSLCVVCVCVFKVNVTYAAAGENNTQLPPGTQTMIASYQITGVADFAKKMEAEGEERYFPILLVLICFAFISQLCSLSLLLVLYFVTVH